MKTKAKAIFKFNNGIGALLCSNCKVIMKTLATMTPEERKAAVGKIDLEPQYCDTCKSAEYSNLIKEILKYIEEMELTIDNEFGSCRENFAELLKDATTNPNETTRGIFLYYKLKKLLDKN